MEAVGIHEADKYGELVANDPDERAILGTLLRVTITRFFRNGWLWEELARQISLNIQGEDRFAVWSAGCAGGEEPFSMAMLLDDLSGEGDANLNWEVTGSDVDPPSLERARNASYQWGAVREVPPKLLERWFRRDSGQWYLDEKIRQMVTIVPHDIIRKEPPGRFNVVLLRNSVLTYNTELVQREVLERIRECLYPPGLLVIGRTEKLPEGAGFEEIGKCIYQKVE
jgi:chemotaxis protein methyltransferase CheR